MYEKDPYPSAPLNRGVPTSEGLGTQFLKFLGELLQTLFLAGLIFIVVNLVTGRIRVEGYSMEPSLHDGEFVVISRVAYQWRSPDRGDIIVFRYPLEPDRRFIKRVIGLPGDVVVIQDGQVFVNGAGLAEDYVAMAPKYEGQWQIGEEEYFVLGDNRNNSKDSHTWGVLPRSNILGKAILVYWPPNAVSLLTHANLAGAAQE